MNPKEELESLKKAALAIATKAKNENRNFTPEEQTDIDAKMARIEELRGIIAEAEKSAATLAALDAMAGGRNIDGNAEFLSFGKSFGTKAVDKLMPIGQKSLAANSSVFVDVELTPTPIPMGRPATSLLDLLPAIRHSQPAYSYIRQTVRTNNAAVVAPGAVKPTSTYTIDKIDGALSVIAHMSEPVHRYWFEDAASLRPFMQEELAYGIGLAVEAKVLADIHATSGLQTQAFDTSALATLRKSITKLETFGYKPAAAVVHPNDWESIELALTTTTAVEYRGLPYDPVARRLFGVPIVVANVQAAGTADVISTGAVAVDTDSLGVLVQWTETSNADDFSKNLVRARMEGRFGTSVFTPMGVVKATLVDD
ncbi:phage major capsid protein [Mycolicibacterium sarraceniae]|uniref:Phage capsid-like C-terminal domain-containing protein n=1 Tax=Mycolicibacterium sarraceniae TaxID=1534348 RepID=A0A7I7ST95_9MYCO|nr:phage major capsid protein [Mycolicibacterium sarraceniae]BBY60222.1 hypothetical protein MSAR_33580 [Mycolicibacterium sarraceniae]